MLFFMFCHLLFQHDLHDAFARCMEHLQYITTENTPDKDKDVEVHRRDSDSNVDTGQDSNIASEIGKTTSDQEQPSQDDSRMRDETAGKRRVATLKEIAQARTVEITKVEDTNLEDT